MRAPVGQNDGGAGVFAVLCGSSKSVLSNQRKWQSGCLRATERISAVNRIEAKCAGATATATLKMGGALIGKVRQPTAHGGGRNCWFKVQAEGGPGTRGRMDLRTVHRPMPDCHGYVMGRSTYCSPQTVDLSAPEASATEALVL